MKAKISDRRGYEYRCEFSGCEHLTMSGVYAAAGVPTPNTPLIPWIDRLRLRDEAFSAFMVWLEERMHEYEGRSLRAQEQGDGYRLDLCLDREAGQICRKILEKLRGLLDEKTVEIEAELRRYSND